MPPKEGNKARKGKKRYSRNEDLNTDGPSQHEDEACPKRTATSQAPQAVESRSTQENQGTNHTDVFDGMEMTVSRRVAKTSNP